MLFLAFHRKTCACLEAIVILTWSKSDSVSLIVETDCIFFAGGHCQSSLSLFAEEIQYLHMLWNGLITIYTGIPLMRQSAPNKIRCANLIKLT